MTRAELRMDLFDFERIVSIGNAATPDKERIVAHCVRVAPSADGIEASATDSYIVATRRFSDELITGLLDEQLLIPSSELFEVMGAIKQMVKIERGKYDPTGWRVTVDFAGDDIDVIVHNSFKEKRGSAIVSKVGGDWPDFSKILDTAPLAVDRITLDPEFQMRLSKSTGQKGARLRWTFTGERSFVFVNALSADLADWSGILMAVVVDKDAA